MTFAQNLMTYRKQAGISQEQLGDAIGVSRQTISKWELGETSPDLDKLQLLSHYFSVSIDELVGQKHEKQKGYNFSPRQLVYEYRSKKQLFGIPLIHINVGLGMRVARGIIAIGNVSVGLISLGFISLGILAFGLLGLGIIGLGVLGIGAIGAGAFSVGLLALGAITFGYLSIGGVAVGVYSLGGLAIARDIAYGGKAVAEVAFNTENGLISFTKQEIATSIDAAFPTIWRFIRNLFIGLGS